MNDLLSKSHTKILKIILSIWAAIISALTVSTIFVFVSKGGYNHPIVFFACILAITTYMNLYRFFSMVYDNNNQISLLQLKVWSMLFVRGVFVSCVYLSFYVMNIIAIIFFSLAYIATFFCNYYLTKARNSEK